MAQKLADGIYAVITREYPVLQQLTEEAACVPRGPGAWTPKQEIGHLIDSATNNHVRFVCAASQDEYTGPGYKQDDWVRLHGYNDLPWSSLTHFWFRYNSLLVQLVQNIPDEKLEVPCYIAGSPKLTLAFVIEDYTLHMQHHIDKILRREIITSYPGQDLP